MCKLLSSTIGIVSWQLLVIASSVNATNALPAGKYGCLTFLGGMNPMYGVGAFGSFILDGKGKYNNPAFKTSGRYDYDGSIVKFSGGKFDGYSAVVKETSSTVTLRFKMGYPRGASSGVNLSQSCTTSTQRQ